MQQGKSRHEIDRMLGGKVPIQFNAMFEVFSDYGYRVTNLDRISHLGMVESTVNFNDSPQIRKQLKAIRTKVKEIFKAMNAKGKMSMDVSWGAHHAVCTTRMSGSPESGVVDADLKVHGVDNVYVCSNASFSTLSAINPTLTLVALSLRLGDHLAGKTKRA
jgi:choline dehydrogenase-like flavoprotein